MLPPPASKSPEVQTHVIVIDRYFHVIPEVFIRIAQALISIEMVKVAATSFVSISPFIKYAITWTG